MIVVIKQNVSKEQVERLVHRIEDMGLAIHRSDGASTTILGLMGDTSRVDERTLLAYDAVEYVRRVTEPYKAVNRKMHPDDTILEVAGRKIGAGYFNVFAGPCSVESEDQILMVAEAVKKAGASFLRGGAFKPRTSPYSFQGMEAEGLRLLLEAKRQTGLPIVTEIMSEKHLDLFADVDIIQLGARNMQNFMLLKELGRSKKPVLMKRGLSATMEEFLMAAEYIYAGGNDQVILCERGIRTFEPMIRNNLDVSAVPLVKKHSHLPIMIDPSHAAGRRDMVAPLSRAAIAIGADGLMIEVHNNPKCALCDGAQSLDMEQFAATMEDVKKRVAFEGRELQTAL
ncbi:MAG: 3-deoxy-7-phosphoheptulonate synthase [Clostridiaceae bacterium]|nr:3-deoxy-7-phosphoheptulonate synthase [Clostridiaceae bacterium]MCI9483333.1 3-deoxy-7-phosphoheptulonate synthase [Clostridiaceae bacterium]MDE7035322.1 3-deoxy-7-phosphoheptulonate synthase [Eubacteriales bacterium]NBH78591.1 3-deoxy-7-phosphoheptulonate synthase [Clostridiaceae bacterium]RKJ80927.1 3-deoxy-7-phosphoheptulonate synthase [Butyricicoccus sp. 1XD8-22]